LQSLAPFPDCTVDHTLIKTIPLFLDALAQLFHAGAVLGKNIWGGGWPLIIWEATTAKQNYYRTNYINHQTIRY